VIRAVRGKGVFDIDAVKAAIPRDLLQVNRISSGEVAEALQAKLAGWVLEPDEDPRPRAVERELIDAVRAELAANCPDYARGGADFRWLVGASIRWLRSRLDATARRASYVFAAPGGDALELALHADYAQFLESADAPGWVSSELTNVGGGRVDIMVLFRESRVPAELKREQGDASRAGLRKYLAQATVYQSTDLCLGLLIVLDLARSAEEIVPTLRDSVWLEAFSDREGRRRCVVVLRLPGNRKSPSALRSVGPQLGGGASPESLARDL
jgi:hypothetical protein